MKSLIIIYFLLLIFKNLYYLECCIRPTTPLDPQPPLIESKDWWSTGSFYQIYPRSFKDSDGDGVGDLAGITEKLSYLHDIGIIGTWLSPIFDSPLADFGYDISDFYNILPEYGTLAEFDELIYTAKKIGIKIILDFVPNHSSDEHEWFKRSVNKVVGYEDFYVWHPGRIDPLNNTKRLVPSNWVSVTGGSVWEWNDQRQEYYLHQFTKKQPDLNYRNPRVVNEMKNVLRFWLNRGIAGFRIDAVGHLYEILPDSVTNQYPDEIPSGTTSDINNWKYWRHDYTFGRPENMDMIYQWRLVLDEYSNAGGYSDNYTRLMMLEAQNYDDPIEILMQYFGNGTHEGAQIPFNFQLMSLTTKSIASDYLNVINKFWLNLPKGRSANWVIGNHDNSRVGNRLGENKIDLNNMIVASLPGSSITYYGEEIGMLDVQMENPNDWRDPERTPFQWDDTQNGGFSLASKTWLPIAENYKEINVKNQLLAEKSYLKCYLAMRRYRMTDTWKYGDTVIDSVNENSVLIIKRSLLGSTTYITVANIGTNQETVNLTTFFIDTAIIPDQLQIYLPQTKTTKLIGQMISTSQVQLSAGEAVILKTI